MSPTHTLERAFDADSYLPLALYLFGQHPERLAANSVPLTHEHVAVLAHHLGMPRRAFLAWPERDWRPVVLERGEVN